MPHDVVQGYSRNDENTVGNGSDADLQCDDDRSEQSDDESEGINNTLYSIVVSDGGSADDNLNDSQSDNDEKVLDFCVEPVGQGHGRNDANVVDGTERDVDLQSDDGQSDQEDRLEHVMTFLLYDMNTRRQLAYCSKSDVCNFIVNIFVFLLGSCAGCYWPRLQPE